MDLQTRKLNIIAYLAQLQDEAFFEKLETYILKIEKEHSVEIKPFTLDELIIRVEKSESDFKKGRFKSQEDLAKIVAKW